MRLQRAIAGLYETIANLAADDFIIYSSYDTALDRICVDVYKNRSDLSFDDLSCYVNGIHAVNEIHALEDELIELHDKYRGKK